MREREVKEKRVRGPSLFSPVPGPSPTPLGLSLTLVPYTKVSCKQAGTRTILLLVTREVLTLNQAFMDSANIYGEPRQAGMCLALRE